MYRSMGVGVSGGEDTAIRVDASLAFRLDHLAFLQGVPDCSSCTGSVFYRIESF